MSQEPKSPSWWHTFPGVLTAVAALITAVTGLLVAVDKAGWFDGISGEAVAGATEPRRNEGTEPAIEARSPGSPGGRASGVVPSMSQVTVGEATYSLLDFRLEPQSPQNFALSISVRMTSHRNHGHNFWDQSFRLLVDDVPRAPVSNLNKVVAGHSAEDGEVRFIVPQGAESLVLQIRDYEDTALIPLELRRP